MTVRPLRRAQGLISAVVAAALLATAACGSNSGGDSQSSGNTTVKIIIAPAINVAVPNLAVDANTGAAHGITLERVAAPSGGSAAQMAALISGSVDMAVMGNNTAVDAIAQGADVRIIAGFGPLLNTLTMSKSAAARTGVAENSPMTEKLQALRGLTVAAPTPGSAGYFSFMVLLRSVGLDPETDLTIAPISDNNAVAAGLKQGTYDAAFASMGAGEVAVADGDAITLGSIPAGDFPVFDDYVGAVLVAPVRLIESNPDLIRRVRATFIDAQNMAVNRSAEAAAALKANSLSALPSAVFDICWAGMASALTVSPELTYTQQNWEKYVSLFSEYTEADYSSLDLDGVVAKVAQA